MKVIITANTEDPYELEDFDALVEYLNEVGFDDVTVETKE